MGFNYFCTFMYDDKLLRRGMCYARHKGEGKNMEWNYTKRKKMSHLTSFLAYSGKTALKSSGKKEPIRTLE